MFAKKILHSFVFFLLLGTLFVFNAHPSFGASPTPAPSLQPSPTPTGYTLKRYPDQKVMMPVSTQFTGYGIGVILQDSVGNTVTQQQDFKYTWTSGNTQVITASPFAACTNGIQEPCPFDHADLKGLRVGETTVSVKVTRVSTGQLVASTLFSIVVVPSTVPTPSITPHPSVTPHPTPLPTPTTLPCIPRPRCLDARPACKIRENPDRPFCKPGAPVNPRPPRPTDLDGNGKVDKEDMVIFRKDFAFPTYSTVSDFNQDGRVDLIDYSLLVQQLEK